MTLAITLPRWYDLHVHLRQGPMMAALIRDHVAMGCAGVLAMPNTKPPVSMVFSTDGFEGWSIEAYLQMIRQAGGDTFSEIIVPLYLTAQTTPAMIAAGAKSGLLKACKYYPPHGTTGAEHGAGLETYMRNGVLAAMEECGVTLCVHGEEHGLQGPAYFDRHRNAEILFYQERLPRVLEAYPRLRISGEHLTTRAAVDFIAGAPDHVAGSITPQHLLYTVSDLLQGLKYHLYCLPLLKFEEDRDALRAAVLNPGNTKFFAGTDSAPHAKKVTECGCAAGCYTGGIAPQLYAQAFEAAGVDLSTTGGQAAFQRFLCTNGPEFYGLPIPRDTFTLERSPQPVRALSIPETGEIVTPLPLGLSGGDRVNLNWRIA